MDVLQVEDHCLVLGEHVLDGVMQQGGLIPEHDPSVTIEDPSLSEAAVADPKLHKCPLVWRRYSTTSRAAAQNNCPKPALSVCFAASAGNILKRYSFRPLGNSGFTASRGAFPVFGLRAAGPS